jgi:23S rRNA (uracil1939-C5)-methyltransferase
MVRIEKPIYGGAGLARDDGKAIFIPYTLPGEYVAAFVTHSKSSFAEAALEKIYEPSEDRTEPPCPYFGVCGGCHYQHANYPAQLAMKAAILEEALTRAHLAPLPQIATHAGQPFGYRNRIRLHLDSFTSALGYRERASHRLLPVDQCPIAVPKLQQALAILAPLSLRQQCGSYFSQVELSINHDATELLLALWPRAVASVDEASTRLTKLCEALQPKLPALRGACVHAPAEDANPLRHDRRLPKYGARQQPKRTSQGRDRVFDAPVSDSAPGAPIARWGASHLTYQVARLDYRVSLGSFFQVNRTLLDTLVQLATGARSGRLAWDLYAGVGLFSRVLAQHFAQVIAVEGAPVSSADLRVNLTAPHLAIRSSTVEFLRRTVQPGKPTPEFVLLDPPRAGLGEETTRLLAQIGPPEITYVSCDPATLSRDLRALVDSGYKLEQLHLIDLFPQTFHLETVAMLSRR